MPGKDTQEEPLASKGHFPTSEELCLDELVAQWVGPDAAPGVLGALHRQPRRIGECVDRYLTRIHQDEEVLMDRLRKHWSQLLGEETSRQLVPQGIRGETLLIAAANQTYLYVFQQPQMKAPLLERLREFTEGRIRDFRLVSQGRR